MNKDSMMKKLYALDFMCVDLHLYLNSHPDDRKALSEYNKTVALAAEIRKDYEKLYGPLTSFRTQSCDDNWNWLSEYSPWDSEYNIRVCEGGLK